MEKYHQVISERTREWFNRVVERCGGAILGLVDYSPSPELKAREQAQNAPELKPDRFDAYDLTSWDKYPKDWYETLPAPQEDLTWTDQANRWDESGRYLDG